MNARRVLFALWFLGFFAFEVCESAPSSRHAAARPSGAEQKMAASGRVLFVNRCARCHSLPKPNDVSAAQWPNILTKMAKRSGLKPEQRQAVLTYLLLARRPAGE